MINYEYILTEYFNSFEYLTAALSWIIVFSNLSKTQKIKQQTLDVDNGNEVNGLFSLKINGVYLFSLLLIDTNYSEKNIRM